ncbi:MbcA/ParS/Xre antitoxin family protein [Polynucleobacter sp. MWH-UH25E]|uniref:MbcA/ParS/Xre antitoxin family protein n=1 Tax=Polynucleobacter sp. MWH-UH25E TaxID=1855616 RepID=UPI001BFE3349|nr:MbcA/ParS/Xre antitoxin family protein [Polynucleobacter sp. MWH-UH25E]QWD62184.1 hypothetical protein ICV39_00760 [Polynucleobacter sp. MWH-UH25E]
MTTKLTSPIQITKPPLGLFDTVPEDAFNFGMGKRFDAKRIAELLNLKKQDVSRLASVSAQSVRYDEAIPEQVRDRLEEIGITINMVAKVFDGDVEKTAVWFRARNPLLGDVSPRDMIRLGRFERLRKFIITAMSANEAQVRRALKTS